MPDHEPHAGSTRSAEVGVGHLVVLLHGQPGGAEIWRAVEARLAGRGLRVVAVDRPGYGASPHEAGGFVHNAEVLADLIDEHGGPAVVVAHSWAAGAAVVAAARHPSRIDGLVLFAPVGDPTSVSTLDRLLGRTRIGRRALRVALAVGGWLVARPGGSRFMPVAGLGDLGDGEARSASRPARDRRARRAAAVEQAALVEELAAVCQAAPQVEAPTVVLTGADDTVVAPAAAAAMAARIPGARVVEVDGGHLLPVEHPAVVAEAVLDLVGWRARRAPAPRGGPGDRDPGTS
jgi:pimeloyl-ACP methyl ester carboxylesterase